MKSTQPTTGIALKATELHEISAGFDPNLLDKLYSDLHSRGCLISKEALENWLASAEGDDPLLIKLSKDESLKF